MVTLESRVVEGIMLVTVAAGVVWGFITEFQKVEKILKDNPVPTATLPDNNSVLGLQCLDIRQKPDGSIYTSPCKKSTAIPNYPGYNYKDDGMFHPVNPK